MLYLVMGVTGSDRSTVGSALASRLDLPFYDADAFRPAVDRAGIDRDEAPRDDHPSAWLARVAAHVPRWEARGGAVLACTALGAADLRTLLGAAGRSRVVLLELDRGADANARPLRDLERPSDAIVVSALLPPDEIVARAVAALHARGDLAPRRLRLARGSRDAVLGPADTSGAVDELLEGLGPLGRVLLVPPDHTRIHSAAGELTVALYERLTARGCAVEVLPATGTHVAMTAGELGRMYPGIPLGAFARHDFQRDLATLGEVPGDFVRDVSDGALDYPIRCQVASRLVEGGWDRIISVGQLVPHEVVGIANHNKNIFVGAGGRDIIDKTHFLGAVCNMERIMGALQSAPREVLNYMSWVFGPALPPITYLLTVRERVGGGAAPQVVTRGLYAGDDEGCFFVGAKLAREVNIQFVREPLRKVVVYLGPDEFRSAWLGNKAIYRTRMALADGAELLVLAPGVDKFGEDPAIDRLIRRHGYRGTPHVLDAVRRDPELADSLSAAAHLIHGSSEGRFGITYAVGDGLRRDEVLGVGFEYADYRSAVRRYDPRTLEDGYNRLPDGEEIFYVSNPALGLWSARP